MMTEEIPIVMLTLFVRILKVNIDNLFEIVSSIISKGSWPEFVFRAKSMGMNIFMRVMTLL